MWTSARREGGATTPLGVVVKYRRRPVNKVKLCFKERERGIQ